MATYEEKARSDWKRTHKQKDVYVPQKKKVAKDSTPPLANTQKARTSGSGSDRTKAVLKRAFATNIPGENKRSQNKYEIKSKK